MTTPTPFPIDAKLTGIAIAYRNPALIADEVLRRTAPVGEAKFRYTNYNVADAFTLPETRVGRKGVPTEVEFGGEEAVAQTEDHGLDDVIPNDDIQNAPAGYDPRGRAVELLTDLIGLGREVRVANLVFNPASYAAGFKVKLEGEAQFSHANSDPLLACETAIETPLQRPNIGVFGQAAWSVYRRHPKVVKAVNRNDGDSGLAARRAVAEILELDEIYVGLGRVNIAKRGQAPNLVRVWGKHIAFLHRATIPDAERSVSFGVTVPFGQRVAGQFDEPKTGLRGSVRVRVGESVKELVTANRAGYLIEDAVA